MVRLLLLSLGVLWVGVGASATFAEEFAPSRVSYNRDIRPILSNNCFACHGPDEGREGGVRLDTRAEADFEELINRITSDDLDLVMPPPESHKTLSDEQVALLSAWVKAGAKYEQHWSFVPPVEPVAPSLRDASWGKQPIDRFVLASLEQEGLAPNPVADKRTLIRRVSFDLTGLPPTRAEIKAFLNDASEDAYERLVDRLMAKPQYGEHMARYWLDLVRFADTNGLHHDHYREMSPYRDWVIRSFNENLPFDEFTRYQLAGDLYDSPTTDQLIASGFNRLHLIIDIGTALPKESSNRNVIDRVTAVGTAFMGLTVQCAVCHDHKYDPITQRDFYQLYAFFNNFDGGPETGRRNTLDFKRGLQPPYLNLTTPEQEEELKRLDQQIAEIDGKINSLKKKRNQVAAKSNEEDSQTDLEAYAKQLQEIKKKREELLREVPATLVMKERAEPRATHLLVRGQYDTPGELVERDVPAFLPPMKAADGLKSRMDLANWLLEPQNPLTGRVTVNRFWQQFFGVGLVKSSEDFGAQGESPSHPELLDYLTLRFIDSGWDVKALVRSIVLTNTYRQSSQASRDSYLADPENRLLARGSRFRLDAEVIRDQVLTVTGLLNPEMYGRSIKTPQPAGLWKGVAMPNSYPQVFQADTIPKVYRRSVYSFWKRGLPPPQMTIFNAPTRESCIARRERTNTPLQALVLMNEQQYFAASMHYAARLLDDTQSDDRQRVVQAYETITSHPPESETLGQLVAALDGFRKEYRADVDSVSAMVNAYGNVNEDHPLGEPSEIAAWTMLIHTLLNLDETRAHN